MDISRNWMANKPLCESCQHHLGSQLYNLVILGLLLHSGKVFYGNCDQTFYLRPYITDMSVFLFTSQAVLNIIIDTIQI